MNSQYTILESDKNISLETKVNEKLRKGWQLYGSPYTVASMESVRHYQAMVYIPLDYWD